jgi:hypothetical protein
MAKLIIIAHISIVLFIALHKNDIGNALLGVDLVGKRNLMLLSSLLDHVSILIFAW